MICSMNLLIVLSFCLISSLIRLCKSSGILQVRPLVSMVSSFCHACVVFACKASILQRSMESHTKTQQRFGATILQKEARPTRARCTRSEEHTSELQSRFDLVCRLLLEK